MSVGNGRPSPHSLTLPPMHDSVELHNGNGNVEQPPARQAVSPTPAHALRPLLGALLTGLVLGGAAGALISAGYATGSSASALVQLAATPDPGIAAVTGGTQSETALADFTGTEFAWLSGDGLASAVATRLNLDPTDAPDIGVTRIGLSPVVEITGNGDTDEDALLVTQTAVDMYLERRQDAFRASVEGSLSSVDATRGEILRNVEDPTLRGAEADARIQRLDTLRADLLLLSNRGASGVMVLDPTALSPRSGPSWLIGTVLGSTLGGLLAVGTLALHRSRRTTLAGPADALEFTDRVLHPEVVLRRNWQTRTLQVLRDRDQYTARLLAAQLARRRVLSGHVIAVVGASTGSMSRPVATMIAVGVAGQVPTVLAEFGPALDRHPLLPQDLAPTVPSARLRITPTQVDGLEIAVFDALPRSVEDPALAAALELVRSGGRCLVLDLGDSADLTRLLPWGCEIVLVLGTGVDDRAHSAALASAVRTNRNILQAVMTRQSWSERLRRRRFGRLDG